MNIDKKIEKIIKQLESAGIKVESYFTSEKDYDPEIYIERNFSIQLCLLSGGYVLSRQIKKGKISTYIRYQCVGSINKIINQLARAGTRREEGRRGEENKNEQSAGSIT